MGRWPRTPDDWRRGRNEHGSFARRHETRLHSDIEPNEAVGVSIRPSPRGVTGEPYPITDGSTGEVDFDARADGSKVAYRTVRAGRNELWERSIVEGQDRLLLSSKDWLFIKPRWSPDGAKLAFSRCTARDDSIAVAVLNTDGSGERVLTKPGHVEWTGRTGRTTARLSLAPVDSAGPSDTRRAWFRLGTNRLADPTVRVIASDPKRNLYNQRFSPDQRWISFLAHDLSYASTSTVYVIPVEGGTWRASRTARGSTTSRGGDRMDGSVYFVSNRTGVANVWARRFDDATGTPIGEPFPVTSFRTAQFQLTPRTVQMDIAITATHLLLPMTESRSEIWMLNQVDR